VIKSCSLIWAGNVTGMKVRTGVCKVLVGKHKRKRPLRRARCKWGFNIKRDVMEICRRAWTSLIWLCENAICEINLTCIRSMLGVLKLVRNDYGYFTL
jgi:hypothetical protein